MVIDDRQVLDARVSPREGGVLITDNSREGNADVFDPAALGTLLIGLGAERAKAQDLRPRRPVVAPVRRPAGIRVALARSLRRAAAMLEGTRIGEVVDQTR